MTSRRARKVAVVSGGSTGIGLACVRHLLVSGWDVAFFSQNADRTRAAEQAILDELRFEGRLEAGVADLRDHDSVRHFFARIRARLGPIGGLVCNAGYSPKGPDGRVPISQIDIAEWNDVVAINQTGALLCCQLSLPDMTDLGAGRVVLIGAQGARSTPRVAGASYIATKSALAGLARSIVSEYSAQGITANMVCPGRILTRMTGAPDSPANIAALERIPIGRLGHPVDIARIVEFLLRDESDFINGAIIDVNGGEFIPA